MTIIIESENCVKIEHILIHPAKKTEEFRKNDTPYAVFSLKKNGKIGKKPNFIGALVKSRTDCLFFPYKDISISSESLDIINHFIKRIKDKHLWFDYKEGIWKND